MLLRMTGRAYDGPPVTGDQVRDTGFLRPHGKIARGYDVGEVDELLRLIAAELDAGRQVGTMIEKATVSTGGRTFTWRRVTRSARPGIAELVRRTDLDYSELPQAVRLDRAVRMLFPPVPIRELLDETGTPILYATGQHYDYGAGAYITFPDERWLKFPVRSTEMENAIMTAVDQAGKVARYRSLPVPGPLGCEITVHPGQQLTTELVLALVGSAPWLRSYFESSGGGG
jgi:DivIVA domain-containing protein